MKYSYLLHCTHSVHLINFGSQTLDFDANVGTPLNYLLSIVGPLRRRSVCIEFDFSGDHLSRVSEWGRRVHKRVFTLRPTKACREPQSTKKPVRSTEVTMPSILTWLAVHSAVTCNHSTYHLALVGPPYDCLVMYDIFSGARAGHDFAIGYVERVQDTHYGVLSCARTLLFLQQFAVNVLADEGTKV